MKSSALAVDAAHDALTRWADAFNHRDWPSLTALYSDDAQLFGGKPALYAGMERVKEYFSVLSEGLSVSFDEPALLEPVADVIVLATTANFVSQQVARPHRLSWVLVRRAEGWRIVSHHASPRSQ
ncbi:MAG: YybH family protein [Janthinobacterium lividum]